MGTVSVVAICLLASSSFQGYVWSVSEGLSINSTTNQHTVNVSDLSNNSHYDTNSLPSVTDKQLLSVTDKQLLSNDSIINDELEKLEKSGYLLFPHIYRAFILAGKSPWEFTISSKCGDQLTSYYNGLNLRQAWAWNMYDSTGKQRAGVFTGALTWAGNYHQCLDALGYHNNLKNFVTGTKISAQYCSVYISTPSWVKELVDDMKLPFPPPNPPFIVDVCTVVGCSETDIHNIVQKFVNKETWLGNYTVSLVKCQVDLKLIEDPGAIIALCIVALILLLVVMGTAFELYLRARRQGVKSSRDFPVGLDTDKETLNLSTLPTTAEDSEPTSMGYTNTAFTSDDPTTQQSDSNHHDDVNLVKGVQSLSDHVQSSDSSHDLQDINLSHSTDTANSSDTRLCDKEESTDNSVDGRSNICIDTNMNGESRGRKASRRLSELMIRSAARLKRSFKSRTNNTDLPRMQKHHLKTRLSINEQTGHNKG
ncbi:hypothetical protein Btru_053177 [Bulinus truncatus]|nr:hypothetical protein Btru_053177 [Bulinus truncatus]